MEGNQVVLVFRVELRVWKSVAHAMQWALEKTIQRFCRATQGDVTMYSVTEIKS